MVYLASGNVFMFAGLLLSPRTFVVLWPLCYGLVFRVISFYPLLYFIHEYHHVSFIFNIISVFKKKKLLKYIFRMEFICQFSLLTFLMFFSF